MTLESAASKAVYTGNGATTEFPFSFKVWDEDQILVSVTDAQGYVQETGEYSVTLSAGGGTVSYLHAGAPLPSGWKLAITRDMPFTQEDDYITGTRFDPEVIETALDKATAERQQLLEQLQRAVILPPTSDETPEEMAHELLRARDDVQDIRDDVQDIRDDVQDMLAEVGTEIGNHSIVTAEGGTAGRTLADRFADVVNVKDFGAVGNGINDDSEAIQAAVNAAVGKLLIVPSGKYNIVGTGIQIPSNVTINLDPNACMYQRGCYRYDNRDTPGTYVPANVVDYNIFWMDNGVENVTISGGTFYGPFYRDGGDYSEQDDSDYDSSRAVESWPASNGIVVRGDDYYAVRKGMPFCTKRSKNITLTGGYYEGWAEDAIQLDQVDNSKVLSNTITRCGRGGVRLYGCHNAWVMFNDISYIYPGDYLNGKNRMYGVTATKVYKPESTYSDNVWMVCNRVYHIPYWKSLDTHGGRRIRFLNNDCRESHIGIGVDKGGESERNGYFPPNDVVIAGNYLLRTLPDSPFEGNATDYGPEYGCAGDGITLFAGQRQDGVDTGLIFGKTAKIYGNTLIGWGGTKTRGALSVSNWQDVNEHDNSIQNSRRCALYISNETQGSFGYGDTIDDVRPSSAGVQLGVTVNPVQTPDGVRGMCDVNIDGIRFINRQESDLTCIELPMSADGYSIIYGSGFSYKNYGTGKIIKYTSNIQYSSPASLLRSQSIAQARVNLDGTLYSNSFNFGVKSCVKSDTGTYAITLDAPALNKYSAIPLAVAVGQGYLANATMTDEQTVTVVTYRSNTLSDAGFNLVVIGC